MRAVIQRATDAKVIVNNKVVGEIKNGLVLLLGVTHDDTEEDIDYLVHKIVHLRIFEDESKKMNLSLMDIDGSVLSISQFTLFADTKKGRRPSFVEAAKPERANELYELFNKRLIEQGVHVETGVFGEMMDIQFTNNGPVTIIIDSKNK